MAGKTNALVGYWNQNFCLIPIKLALSCRKTVEVNSSLWRSIVEITE
jgi:6-phosphofructokinase 1